MSIFLRICQGTHTKYKKIEHRIGWHLFIVIKQKSGLFTIILKEITNFALSFRSAQSPERGLRGGWCIFTRRRLLRRFVSDALEPSNLQSRSGLGSTVNAHGYVITECYISDSVPLRHMCVGSVLLVQLWWAIARASVRGTSDGNSLPRSFCIYATTIHQPFNLRLGEAELT